MAILKLPAGKKEIRAIGFDVDGVLRDTGKMAYDNCCSAIKILGGKPPKFKNFLHEWGGELITYYRSCGVTASDEEIHRVNQGYIVTHDSVSPFDDVRQTVKHLDKSGVKVFALSGHMTHNLLAWFVEHNLQMRFAHIRGDGRDKKKELADLCKVMGTSPSITGYIGDWGQDMRAARDVGMVPIGITRGHDSRDVLVHNGAKLVIEHLADLCTLVE